MTLRLRSSRILSDRHCVPILLHLYLNGPQCKSEIYRSVSTNPRMPDKIDSLVSEGMVYSERDPFRGNRTLIGLTDQGIAFSEILYALENLSAGHDGRRTDNDISFESSELL